MGDHEGLSCFKLLSSIQSLISSATPKKVMPIERPLADKLKDSEKPQAREAKDSNGLNLSGATVIVNLNINIQEQDLSKATGLVAAGAMALISSASIWASGRKTERIKVPLLPKIKVPLLSKIRVPKLT